MLLLCYPGCTTCHKTQKWLDENHIKYDWRNIKEQNPTEAELRRWLAISGLPIKRFFNTSGLAYKAQHLKERLPQMSEDDMLALLATDGMLVKRPLLVADRCVLVGFRQQEWEQALL